MYLFLNKEEIDDFLFNFNFKLQDRNEKSIVYFHKEMKIITFLNERSIDYINLEERKCSTLYGPPVIFEYLKSPIFYTVQWKIYSKELSVGRIFYNKKEKDLYLIDCPSTIYSELNFINNIGPSLFDIGEYLFNFLPVN